MQHLKMSLAVILAACAGAAAARDGACARKGPGSPVSLHKQWIMEGWERRNKDPTFVFAEKMTRYYDMEDKSGVFYDSFAPGSTKLFRDSAKYGKNWEDLFNQTKTVRHGITDGVDQIVGDSVASTTLGFVGQVDHPDGEVLAFGAPCRRPS